MRLNNMNVVTKCWQIYLNIRNNNSLKSITTLLILKRNLKRRASEVIIPMCKTKTMIYRYYFDKLHFGCASAITKALTFSGKLLFFGGIKLALALCK